MGDYSLSSNIPRNLDAISSAFEKAGESSLKRAQGHKGGHDYIQIDPSKSDSFLSVGKSGKSNLADVIKLYKHVMQEGSGVTADQAAKTNLGMERIIHQLTVKSESLLSIFLSKLGLSNIKEQLKDAQEAFELHKGISISSWKSGNVAEHQQAMQAERGKAETLERQEPVKPASPQQATQAQVLSSAQEALRGELRIARSVENAKEVYKQVRDNYQVVVDEKPEIAKLNLVKEKTQILGTGGLNVMIEHLKAKESGANINCFVCNNLQDLEKMLAAIKDSSFTGKISLLVRSAAQETDPADREYHHVTPVLIERQKGEGGEFTTKTMIMDSVGSQKVLALAKMPEFRNFEAMPVLRGSYTQHVYNRMREIIPEGLVYTCESKRQIDSTNCPIFSLNDVKQFFKNERFFEDVDRYGGLQEVNGDSLTKQVTNLPPENMKLTQSMTQLNNYLEGIDPDTVKWFATKPRPLKQSIAKSSRRDYSTDKLMNQKAADRFAKYLHVITNYARNLPISDLEQLTQKYDSKKVTPDFLNGLNKQA